MRTNVVEVRGMIKQTQTYKQHAFKINTKTFGCFTAKQSVKTNNYLNKQTNNRKQTKVLIRTTDILSLHLRTVLFNQVSILDKMVEGWLKLKI